MNIFTQLLNDKAFARSQKDWFGLDKLNLVISEVQRKQKNLKDIPTDQEVLSVLKGLIKSTEFTVNKLLEKDKAYDTAEYVNELRIYNSYLPVLLSEEETQTCVKEAIETSGATSMKDIGKVMGLLKKTKNLDMKLASQLVKSYL